MRPPNPRTGFFWYNSDLMLQHSIRLISFDCDGTLFDTREDIADAVNYARRFFRLPELSLSTVTQMVGDGVAILAERAFRGTDTEPERARQIIMDYYTAHPGSKARLYPGVRETLPRLDAVCTVISNKPKELVDALLADHHIADFFEFVAGGDTFERRKPHPMALIHVMRRHRVDPAETVVVGDHAPDIEMAKAAGAKSIYCNYGFFGNDHVGADLAIDCFSQLGEALDQLKRMHAPAS